MLSLVHMGVIAASALTLSPASFTHDDTPENLKAAAKATVEADVVPFLTKLEVLRQELQAANTARKDWTSYSEDWKKWSPEEAEKNANTFTYGEYLWSGRKDKAFRQRHTDSPAAQALRDFQGKSAGRVLELFVTDAHGANVCQTQITSDWFQGDEPKFTEVSGKTHLFIAEPKRDDTVGKMGVQVSIPLYEKPDGQGAFIGVAVVTVAADETRAAAAESR